MINPIDRPSTRQRILEKSLKIFADLGFEGTTTRRIADGAGVNVGLIQYYFGSKEQLWQEAAGLAFAELRDALGDTLPALHEASSVDLLRGLARRFTLFVSTKPDAVRLMQDAGTHDGDHMRWLVDTHLRPIYEVLRAGIVRLQRDGSLPDGVDPLHLFYLVAGSMTLIFHQAPECLYLTGTDPREPAVAEAHADALIRLLTLGGSSSDEAP